jgi:hypothetical protein
MMLETLPWPQVLLGLAAALAVLVIYDVAYVWPLCRRYAALAERCRGLESSMAGIAGLASGIAELERRAADHWHKIGERLGHLELATEGRAYEQAIGFAEQGGDTHRLKACFGLTDGEAELVQLLHGGQGTASPAARSDPDRPARQ